MGTLVRGVLLSVMYAIAVAIAIYALMSCSSGIPANTNERPDTVHYYHDTEHGVSCWLFGDSRTYGRAISCLPDSVLKGE